MPNIKIITDRNFDSEVLHTDRPVVVDFMASWCGPCKAMAPFFDAVSDELPDYTFAKVDVDDSPDAANRYGIRSVPTLAVFNKGEIVALKAGAMNRKQMRDWIEASFDW